MAAVTNIIAKDDTATAWTFIPIGKDSDGNPVWRCNTAGLSVSGQPRLSVSVQTLKSGDFKVTAKVEVPVMEAQSDSGDSSGYLAAPKVAYVVTGIFTMFASQRSSSSDRANLVRLLVGLVQGATSTVDTGTLANSAVAGTWNSSTAPITQLFTQMVTPY
jgi:hypothetical protein